MRSSYDDYLSVIKRRPTTYLSTLSIDLLFMYLSFDIHVNIKTATDDPVR